jgi:hypothetical protein
LSQRRSGYERKTIYETPEWVTSALLAHGFRKPSVVWEPACGNGKMVRILELLDAEVIGTDLSTGQDFFTTEPPADLDAIITNPPFELAQEFIERALDLTREARGFVAMLLRTDFDHAKTRQHIFKDHPAFAGKLVLTKRIRWFEDTIGSPSVNHAWFYWDWRHGGKPVISYGPIYGEAA